MNLTPKIKVALAGLATTALLVTGLGVAHADNDGSGIPQTELTVDEYHGIAIGTDRCGGTFTAGNYWYIDGDGVEHHIARSRFVPWRNSECGSKLMSTHIGAHNYLLRVDAGPDPVDYVMFETPEKIPFVILYLCEPGYEAPEQPQSAEVEGCIRFWLNVTPKE